MKALVMIIAVIFGAIYVHMMSMLLDGAQLSGSHLFHPKVRCS